LLPQTHASKLATENYPIAGRTDATLSGNGGDITLEVGDLLLMRNGNLISTEAGTALAGGNGGNIRLDADFVVAVPREDSNISDSKLESDLDWL
jgi:large exoprotein involved in heme utilization and adhesion